MKLRNKKNGEIVNAMEIDLYTDVVYLKISKDGRYDSREYESLAELNEEWEDYEEPKGYWYINEFGTPTEITHKRENIYDTQRKNFGNYFETKEEAEKVVEKLKAWKRLKDRGFRFDGYNACSVNYDIDEQYRKYISQDLDLLFSQEDD